MSDLRAEQRADKNGKVVTRHVKNGDRIKPPVSLPAPLPVAAQNREPLDVIRDILNHKLDEGEAKGLTGYLSMKAPVTKSVVADALLHHENEREFEALMSMIGSSVPNAMLQLIVSDVKFALRLSEVLPSRHAKEPLYGALMVMESAYTAAFSGRGQLAGKEPDLTRHAPLYRGSVIARIMEIHDSAPSTFYAYEQSTEIASNMSTFMPHLEYCRKISLALSEEGEQATLDTMYSVCRLLNDFPDSGESLLGMVETRGRFNEDEARQVLSTTKALSQGAL